MTTSTELSAAADLISAQAEQGEESLKEQSRLRLQVRDLRTQQLVLELRIKNQRHTLGSLERKLMERDALALPITEAERVARENAEKAVLLEAIERNGWTLEYRESLRPELRWLVRKQVQHVATGTTALEALCAAKEASNASK